MNPSVGRATDGVWVKTASGGLWSDAANWSGGVVADGTGAVANFATLDLTANNTVGFDAPRTLGSLNFGDATSTYYNWTLSNNGSAANVLTLDGAAPAITINNGICTNNLVLAGVGGLTVNGGPAVASSLVLGAANTFTGNLILNAGAVGNLNVFINNTAAFGGSAGAPNSVAMVGNAATRSILNLSVSGATYPAYNTLIMRPTGASTSSRTELRSVNGSATWSGNIVLDGVSASMLPRADFYCDASSATFTVNGNISSVNDFAGQLDLRGAATGVINGSINVPGTTVVKDDAGTWTLSAPNNIWSNTVVGNGTLKLGGNNVLPATAGLAIGGNGTATLDLNGYNQTVTAMTVTGSNAKRITSSTGTAAVLTVNNSADVTFAGVLMGGLNLNKVGTGTLTLSGVNTYTGNTVVGNGTLVVTSAGSISGTTNIIIEPGAKLSPAGLSLAAGQKLSPVSDAAIIGGSVNVSAGTLVLNYTVGTPALTVSGGNLALASGSSVIINVTGSLTAGATYQLVAVNSGGQVSGVMPSSVVLKGANGAAGSLLIIDSQLYLTLDTKPLIASQAPVPYTNIFTLFEGACPTFSVTAGGLPPFSYKWYTNGVLNASATSSAMVWTNVKQGSISAYCVVANANGSISSTVWSAAVVPAPVAPYPLAVMSNSLVGYWRLNEPDDGSSYNSDVLAHDYWGGNNGLYSNTGLGASGYSPSTDPTTTSAMFGIMSTADTAARGIAGIDFAAPANTGKAFSIEAWVAGWATIADSGIVAKGYGGGGEQFNLDAGAANHAFRFLVRDAAGVSHVANSTIAPDNTVWHHLVGVCDEPNGVVTLYIDGRVAATATIATNAGILTSTSLMSIGARYSSSTALANNTLDNEFLGYVNDVAAYNVALTASQVQDHYFAAGIAPVFFSQPLASTNVNQNGTLTASCVANGTQPLTYSWFDMNAGSYIAGQTNATLVVKNFQVGNSYYVTVANAYGSTNSSTITASVTDGFTVSMAPAAGNLALYSGLPVSFAVTASGTEPFYFRWFTNGVAVPNATNANYVLTVPLGSSAVSCVVSNSYSGLSSQTLGPVNLTGVTAPTNAYQVAILSNSPVAYWTLSEAGNGLNNGNAGVVAYDYVGGHNGSYVNVNLGLSGFDATDAPWLTAAQFGAYAPSNCVLAEADNSGNGVAAVDFARPTGSDAQFSVEAWVSTTANANATIVAKGNGHSEQFSLDVYSSGFRFVVRDAAGVSHVTTQSDAPTVGQWYHVVGVWDGTIGTARVFVNGANVRTLSGLSTGLGLWTPANNALLASASRVHIGAQTSDVNTNAFDLQFRGKIAQVALYNYVLSTNQVVAHYYSATNSAVVTPGVMAVSKLGNGQLQLSWGFSGTLQSATNVAGPYSTETGAVSPYTITTTNAQRFYRIKQQ